MIKRTLTIVAALALLLCACGEAGPEAASTEARTEASFDPNPSTAIMEPLQGGPMLYAFPGEDSKTGLVNQDGEVVAEPQYDGIQYVYGDIEETQVIGLLARKPVGAGPRGVYTYYGLDGKAKAPDWGKAYEITVAPGGHYAVVNNGLKGLFDIEANTYAVKPSKGGLGVNGNAIVIGQQCYLLETGKRITLPSDLGTYYYCFPEVEWFCFLTDGGYRWYDKSFNHMPQLDRLSINRFKGKYAVVYIDSNQIAWTDREGNIVLEKPGFKQDGQLMDNLNCFALQSYAEEQNVNSEKIPTLLDPDLQTVFTGEPGDSIRIFDGPLKGYVLLDKQQQIKASCDAYGKPLPANATAIILATSVNYPWCYKLKDGVWQALDLSPYGLRQDFGDYGFQEAVVLAACDEFLWINGWHDLASEMHSIFEHFPSEFFALDWDGNPYPDCPLQPFSGNVSFSSDTSGRYLHWPTAGEQGPDYYWVEKDGKRGYINTKGEWLFVDTAA